MVQGLVNQLLEEAAKQATQKGAIKRYVGMEEILHQLIGGLSHYLQGFNHPRWYRIKTY